MSEKEEIKNYIRGRITEAGSNISDSVRRMNAAYTDREETQPNISNQISKGNIPYWKACRLASVLGYKIKWEKDD